MEFGTSSFDCDIILDIAFDNFYKTIMDKITIQIRCLSDFCEKLREEGLFFETIAGALDIDRDDIVEIEDDLDKK